MTLDEAIVHAREVASEQKRRSGACVQNDSECDKFSTCLKCAEEHEQLAGWLEELKVLRLERLLPTTNEIIASKVGYETGYNKAIDDFVNACKENVLCKTFGFRENDIEKIAEQLKAGGDNE